MTLSVHSLSEAFENNIFLKIRHDIFFKLILFVSIEYWVIFIFGVPSYEQYMN